MIQMRWLKTEDDGARLQYRFITSVEGSHEPTWSEWIFVPVVKTAAPPPAEPLWKRFLDKLPK